MKKTKEKKAVSFKEEIIAAILLFIGIALILAYTLSAKEMIDSETEIIQKKLDFYYATNTGELAESDQFVIERLNFSGEEYLDRVRLDTMTSVLAKEGGGYIISDDDGNTLNETMITDDEGREVSVLSKDGGLSFKSDSKDLSSFELNGYTFKYADGFLYVDNLKVYIPIKSSQTTTDEPSVSQTSKKSSSASASSAASLKTTSLTQSATAAKTVTSSKNKTKTTKASVRRTTTTKTTKKKTKTTTTKKKTTTTKAAYYSSNASLNEVVSLVNKERAQHGLSSLSMNSAIQKAAAARAKEAAKSFSHTRPNGSSCSTIMADYGISYSIFGENLAAGSQTPSEAVSDWMNSPSHRNAILNKKFKYIGVGYYYKKNDPEGSYYYWSQLFYA